MIGWENDRGAYYINQLQEEVNDVKETADSAETNIGKMSDLTTTSKTTLVGAINEVDGNADSANTAIGTLASLTTTDKTDLVSAINEVDTNADIALAHFYQFGSIGGSKQCVITNNTNIHCEMLLIGCAIESSLKYCAIAIVSGSSSSSQIFDVMTQGSNVSATKSGKTITITNNSSSNMRLYGIILSESPDLTVVIQDKPST